MRTLFTAIASPLLSMLAMNCCSATQDNYLKPSDTCLSSECCSFDVSVPNIAPGVELTGGVLFLKPSADNLGWGVVTDFLPFITPNWEIKALKPDYQAGFTLGASYAFCNTGMNAQLFWDHLRTSDSQSVSVTRVLQWVSPFCQTGPGTASTTYDPTGVGELITAHAQVKFKYDVVNLDVGTFVNIGSYMQMRIFSGLSGVYIKERLFSTFEGVPTPPKISLNNTSSYWGIGPRFGFVSTYKLYKHFRFVGQLAASLLFGSMQPAEYRFKGSSASLAAAGISVNPEKISSDSVSQTVPSLDGKLGLSYDYQFPGCYMLTLEAGYMGAIYINPLSGYETNENVLPLEIGSLSTGSMKHIQSNFSLNGPYVTMSLKF